WRRMLDQSQADVAPELLCVCGARAITDWHVGRGPMAASAADRRPIGQSASTCEPTLLPAEIIAPDVHTFGQILLRPFFMRQLQAATIAARALEPDRQARDRPRELVQLRLVTVRDVRSVHAFAALCIARMGQPKVD